ncbi:MAG: MFS transporter [Oenococcus sp.]|uniref:MFS transporter n=1 Tax=Lactobacillaceae TaxID=33958 RepID=UPI0039E85DA4
MNEKVQNKTKLSVLAVGLLSFVGILIETSMNVTFPTIMQEMKVSLSTVQWLTTGYLLLVTITMSATAYLLKKFDTKQIFIWAVTFNLIGTICCALSNGFAMLLSGRLLQSVSTGLASPALFFIIVSTIPRQKLGQYMGFAAMLVSLAPALGPTYGGILNYYFSWRMIFWPIIPLLLIVLWLGNKNISLSAKKQKIAFDFIGLLLMSLILVGIEFSLDQFSRYGWGFRLQSITIVLITLIIAYSIYNHLSSKHLLDFSILTPIVSLRLFNYFSLQFINIGLSFLIPIFAETVLKASSLTAGLLLLPGSLLGSALAPFAGKWYDRSGYQKPLVSSNILVLIGLMSLLFFANDLSVCIIVVIYIILRLGFNLGFGNTMSDASKFVAGNKHADQSSIFNMAQQYAGSIGTVVMSMMISIHTAMSQNAGSLEATQKGADSDFVILIIISLLALLGTFISKLFIKKEKS